VFLSSKQNPYTYQLNKLIRINFVGLFLFTILEGISLFCMLNSKGRITGNEKIIQLVDEKQGLITRTDIA
jgi:hypothetical protein